MLPKKMLVASLMALCVALIVLFTIDMAKGFIGWTPAGDLRMVMGAVVAFFALGLYWQSMADDAKVAGR